MIVFLDTWDTGLVQGYYSSRQVVDSKTKSMDLSNSLTRVNPEKLVDMVNFQRSVTSQQFLGFCKNQPYIVFDGCPILYHLRGIV